MNTPSHFIVTAALRKALPRVPMVRSAVLLGSVVPDIPLYLLSFGAFFYFERVLGWSRGQTFRHIYGVLYFEDAGWIAAHSFLHAPFVLLAGLAVAHWAGGPWPRLGNWMRWFLYACLLHCVIDVATHFDDGPVLLWPFDWRFRFSSPLSYWDPAHYGRGFALFEGVLDVVLLGYLGIPWLLRRFGRRRVSGADETADGQEGGGKRVK